ncbi:hypothetical protein ACFL3S_02000 [Gemmatimonadota bacterium]
MKRDILAAFTFLATGVLFYVAQAERPQEGFFSESECGVVERVWTGEEAPDHEMSFKLKETPRDS